MSEYGVLGVRDIEALVDQLVEKILGHFCMDRQIVISARKLCNRPGSPDEGESGDTVHRKRFQVIAAKKDDDLGLGFIQDFSKLTHRRDTSIQHFGLFIRRPDDQLWRVNRAECSNNFAHAFTP